MLHDCAFSLGVGDAGFAVFFGRFLRYSGIRLLLPFLTVDGQNIGSSNVAVTKGLQRLVGFVKRVDLYFWPNARFGSNL